MTSAAGLYTVFAPLVDVDANAVPVTEFYPASHVADAGARDLGQCAPEMLRRQPSLAPRPRASR